MRPHPSFSLPAMAGSDYIRGPDWKPVKRTEKGWKYWAELEARRKSKRDRFQWHAVVAWIEERGCWRINFAGQQEQ